MDKKGEGVEASNRPAYALEIELEGGIRLKEFTLVLCAIITSNYYSLVSSEFINNI